MNNRNKTFEYCEHEVPQKRLKGAAHEHKAAVVAGVTRQTHSTLRTAPSLHAYCECFRRLVTCEGLHIVEFLVEASHPNCVDGFTHARHAHV